MSSINRRPLLLLFLPLLLVALLVGATLMLLPEKRASEVSEVSKGGNEEPGIERGPGVLSAQIAPEAVDINISANQTPPLQERALAITRAAGGKWGVVAYSLDKKQPLILINPNDVLVPASNNKVFSAIWALDMLGPDYRFPTDLLLTGKIRDGVLTGDVFLRGSGDPAFGYPEYEDENMEPLRRMAEFLKEIGVQSIEGDLIADGTVFDSVRVGPAWPLDTGGGSASYAPRVSGLPFQRNLVHVLAHTETPSGPPVARLDPPVSTIPYVSTLRRGGNSAWAARIPNEDTIRVRGVLSTQRPQRYRVGVSNPELLTIGALEVAIREAGINFSGTVKLGKAPEDAHLVYQHFSVPLAEMIPQLNRKSDNFFAEHLWKAAAAAALEGEGSYARGGPASALHFMHRAGVQAGEIYQADGSGLSSQNRASASALVKVLAYAHNQPWSDLFHESLAVAGDPNGSMRRLYRGTPAEGNLHGKTGYIRNVRTLSGYVRSASGELIVFSFLYNGGGTSAARGAQTELGNLLATYGGSATAAAPGRDTTE